MGGGSYSGDVGARSRSSNREHFTYQGHSPDPEASPERQTVHPDLDPKGVNRECRDSTDHPNTTPIVVAMDVTRSRGDDAKVIYGKLPMFIGQIIMKDYLAGSHPEVSFAAIGDAGEGDVAPIQVGQFESDNRLDDVLGKIWLEEGGGGNGLESYEVMAYYYARHTDLDATKRGEKGFFFFLGDEGFYPFVKADQIRTIIGDDLKKDIPSEKIFEELKKKFHVFFIFQQKSKKQREKDIDAEFKKRVEQEGGQYKDVDVRVSLLWNNRNDLDLHVITPSGEEIYYQHKHSECGGALDVDRNVHGEMMKPIENVRWPKGKAPKGKYRVIVQNFGCHGKFAPKTDFKVEVEVNGEISYYEGTTPAGKTGGASNRDVVTFEFDPSNLVKTTKKERYALYDDQKIIDSWVRVLGPENVLICEDPKAIVDIQLGAMAITQGTRDMDAYLVDMKGRDQSHERLELTQKALATVAGSSTMAQVAADQLPAKSKTRKRGGSKSSRL